MKTKHAIGMTATGLLLLGFIFASSDLANGQKSITGRTGDESLKNEAQLAVDKGIKWLQGQQGTNGAWSNPEQPALTALALTACMGGPSGANRANRPGFVDKGYAFLLSCVKPDGGVYVKALLTYNTSLAMMALLSARDAQYDTVIRNARNFVVSAQNDFGEKGKIDNAMDGGFGYSADKPHSDLSNTLVALEAIHFSERLAADRPPGQMKELNWDAAIQFIQRCQNLPAYNHESWASDDPRFKGGFIYAPGESKAGETNSVGGRVALRSYGSMSYAGLLSYIYANLKPSDPRVQAVSEWLRQNFTLEENPAMGKQGLFYYYHTMAKGLSAAGMDTLELGDGKKVNWREELVKKLLNLQNADGSWSNDNGRFMEKDPVLVTAYSLIALEYIARGL